MKNSIKIGFSGDLSFSGHFNGSQNDDQLFDMGIRNFLDTNDYNVINFESPVTVCRVTKKRRLAHRCGPDALDFVKRNIKNPVLSYANNHMQDYDRIGTIDTIEFTREAGIPFMGLGLNVNEACAPVIVGEDVKVGLLAVQYKQYKIAGKRYGGPLHDSKEKYFAQTIKQLKAECDYVVMVYHGGEEFLHAPMPYIRKRLKHYLDLGCDVIVAHHPHVVQGYEYVGKKAIFYSLGNFVFDTDYQRVMPDSDKGILVSLTFDKDGFSFETLSTLIDRENHKVISRMPDEDFINMADVNYSKLWCTEAYRQLDIRARAAELKEKEITEREERFLSEKDRIEAIELAAELAEAAREKADDADDDDEVLDETDDVLGTEPEETDAENVKKKRSFRSVLKKLKRKWNNRKEITLAIGRTRAKLFYKSSIK